MSGDTATTRSRGVRVLGSAFLAIFVLLCIAALVGYRWQATPAHWTDQQERIAAMSPQERQDIREALLNRLLNKWSESPKDWTLPEELIGQRTTLEIPYEALNVWLAEEGIGLLAEIGIELPKSVKGAMVDSAGDGLLRISCDIENSRMKQVVALTFAIQVDDDGTVTSSLQTARAGRLPLPTQKAIDLIARRSDGEGMMLALMQGTPVGPIEMPIDPSEDGLRNGRLVGLQIRDDAMVITRETVRRQKTND